MTAIRSRHLIQSTSIVMLFFIVSRSLGLVRDIAITSQFGTSAQVDAYLAAFRVPDFIFSVVAGGALASAFIPPFSALLAEGDTRGSWRLATQVINAVFLATAAICLVTAVFAEPLVTYVIAPGFTPEQQQLTANLMRLMLVTPLIFSVSGIVMGILNAHHHFLLPAAAPALYNLGIIFGALVLSRTYGVYGLAFGVIIGALLHLAIQVPWLVRQRIEWTRGLGTRDPQVRHVFRLMLPRTAGIAAVQVNFLVNVFLASLLPTGSLAALNYAFLLMLLPEGVIAQSVATVFFPTFARLAALGQHDQLRRAFSTVFRVVMFLAIPASVGLYLLRVPLITLLFQRGDFTAESTQQTAYALQFFALGLFAHSGLEILTRTFYALHDTGTPVRIGVAAVGVNIVLSLLLIQPMAQGGLALANSIATILEMFALLWLLRPRLDGIDGRRIGRSVGKILIGSAVMAAVIVGVMVWLGNASVWILLPAGIGAGAAVYLLAMAAFRSEEVKLARELVMRR